MILIPHFTSEAWGVLADLGVTQSDYSDYLAEVEEVASVDPDCTKIELGRGEILRMLQWMHDSGVKLDAEGITSYCLHLMQMLLNPIGRA